jgi:hypothetical protein
MAQKSRRPNRSERRKRRSTSGSESPPTYSSRSSEHSKIAIAQYCLLRHAHGWQGPLTREENAAVNWCLIRAQDFHLQKIELSPYMMAMLRLEVLL